MAGKSRVGIRVTDKVQALREVHALRVRVGEMSKELKAAKAEAERLAFIIENRGR